MSLNIYRDNGFKLFQCNPDKTPATPGFWPKEDTRKKYNKDTGEEIKNSDWKEPENQVSFEAAEMLQSMGEMIGACIPEDIIVIDLDRHKPEEDGVKSFKAVKEKYNINLNITSETFTVVTARGGYHIFLSAGKDHGIPQRNNIEPGIDTKTSSGYVIAAGSPGYSIHPDVIDLDIIEIPEQIQIWLETVTKKEEKKEKSETDPNKVLLPVELLVKILNKLDVKLFDSNDKWYELIVSAIATAGNNNKVIEALAEWSAGDTRYKSSQAYNRIKSFNPEGDITTGTFIHILRENNISQYFIKKVLSFNMSIELYDNMRDDGSQLPFPEPNYDEISSSKEANELFLTAGNSVAATLLGYAVQGYIIYCEADKAFYLFNGSRWEEFQDMFSITYTVLIRLCKFMFAKKRGSDVAGENFLKLIKAVNKTHWKFDVLRELQCREGVFQKKALWDSEKLKETLTTIDGVIDFTGSEIINRQGIKEEFRKTFVPYKTDEILKAKIPVKFNEFLSSLFPDPDTLFTARQSSSMFISGNAKKVFQIYHGAGDNGKSTWIEIEKELFGEKAHTYSTSLILNNKYGDDKLPPEAADFMGKYLLYGSEIQKGKQLSLGKIKNFTGDDTIAATPKYKDQREFRPTWQMVLSVNDLPFFDGADRAFINRLLVLPFEKTFVDSKEDKQNLIIKGYDKTLVALKIDSNKLKKDIRLEFPAVMNQKINDYVDLKNNYNGIIKQSEKCKIHKETYISDNNDIENFIIEQCVILVANDLFTSSEKLTDAYREYVDNSKISSSYVIRAMIKTRQELQKQTKIITETYHNPVDNEYYDKKIQRRGLKNIRLKTIEEIELENNMNKKYDDDIPI